MQKLAIKKSTILGDFIKKEQRVMPEVYKHCFRTADYAGKMAAVMGYSADMILEIMSGALIHDYGKIMMPEEILNKEGPLTKNEMDKIKEHPYIGYLSVQGKIGQVAQEIVLRHHEKLDGSGYPNNLRDIPEYIQIVTVADMYDAMTSKRSYKCVFSQKQAMRFLYADVNEGKVSKTIVDAIRTVVLSSS